MEIRQEIIDAVLYGKNQRHVHYKHGQPYFPTICVCLICHGVRDASKVMLDDGTSLQPTPDEAFMLALVEHGTYIEKWAGSNVGNANNFPTRCTCKCEHVWEQTSRPPTPYSGLHTVKCQKCGMETGYDTSD